MNQKEKAEIREKILKGLKLSYERMLVEKELKNQEIVILRNDKIVSVPAKEMLIEISRQA
jgi:hypothetical protein